MRNGAPRVCHVVFKLKICFPPSPYFKESTSGCIILPPHYNTSFLTVFQPSVYSLIPWLPRLQVIISSCVSSFVMGMVSNGVTQTHIVVVDDRQTKPQNYPVFFSPPTFAPIISDFPQAVNMPDLLVQLLRGRGDSLVLQEHFQTLMVSLQTVIKMTLSSEGKDLFSSLVGTSESVER